MLEIDTQEIESRLERVDKLGIELNEFVDRIVAHCCRGLDEFMAHAYELLSDKEVDVQDVDIEYMALQLPCLLYFASNSLEDLGLREDIARKVEKELYSTTILGTEGKVAEKESAAQIATRQEALVTAINARAYRKVRSNIEFALETLGSLKKVLTNRISNRELTQKDK